jgi:zinc transport system substrate-binding protein
VRTVRVFLLVLLACLTSLACGACTKKPAPRLKVVVTVFPVYDLTRRIAGPDADVVLLIVPGRPEMDIRPSEKEADAATGAMLGIRVGLGLDDWLQDVLDTVAPKARRLAVGERVPTLVYKANPVAQGLARNGMAEVDPHLAGKPDPYVWLDPQRAELIVKAIAEEMARADVAHASAYRERSTHLEKDLEALDHEVEARVATWATRSFVSFRPAFGYFADRYHLDVAGTLEAYPGKVPPLRYDQDIVKLVRAKGLAGLFKEPQFPPKPAITVSAATHLPIGVLDALGGDAPVDSYEKLIRFDTDALEPVMKAPPLPPPPLSPPTAPDADAGQLL